MSLSHHEQEMHRSPKKRRHLAWHKGQKHGSCFRVGLQCNKGDKTTIATTFVTPPPRIASQRSAVHRIPPRSHRRFVVECFRFFHRLYFFQDGCFSLWWLWLWLLWLSRCSPSFPSLASHDQVIECGNTECGYIPHCLKAQCGGIQDGVPQRGIEKG